jgi:hypothetical protein
VIAQMEGYDGDLQLMRRPLTTRTMKVEFCSIMRGSTASLDRKSCDMTAAKEWRSNRDGARHSLKRQSPTPTQELIQSSTTAANSVSESIIEFQFPTNFHFLARSLVLGAIFCTYHPMFFYFFGTVSLFCSFPICICNASFLYV